MYVVTSKVFRHQFQQKEKSTSPKKKHHKRPSTTVVRHITSEDDRANLSGLIDTDTDDDIVVLPKTKRKKTNAAPRVEVETDKTEDSIMEEVRNDEKVSQIYDNIY